MLLTGGWAGEACAEEGYWGSALDPASLFLVGIKNTLPVSPKQESGMAADGSHTCISLRSQDPSVVSKEECVCNVVMHYCRLSDENCFFGREQCVRMMLLPPLVHAPSRRQVNFCGLPHCLGTLSQRVLQVCVHACPPMCDKMTPFHGLRYCPLKIAHQDSHLCAMLK